MTIRLMAETDYDLLFALWQGTAGMGLNPADDSREGIVRYLRRNPTTCFIAEEGGALIGAILSGHDGRRAYVYHMAVAEAYRRRGIGEALLERALDALSREGISKAALLVFATNEKGNAFWEKNGFFTRRDVLYRNRDIEPFRSAE
jgi:ribosomal protein S18 acetylase RimI-like enzyme